MVRPSTASLERDAGRLLRRPSVLSSLGGCPASCPDTYRLTHDHRHVRNWARLEIVVLILLRNIFFRLGTNFRTRAYRLVLSARVSGASEAKHEQTLRFSRGNYGELLHAARSRKRLCRSGFSSAPISRASRTARCAAPRG